MIKFPYRKSFSMSDKQRAKLIYRAHKAGVTQATIIRSFLDALKEPEK